MIMIGFVSSAKINNATIEFVLEDTTAAATTTMMSSSSGSNNNDANKENTAAVTASAAASTTTTTTMQTPPLLSLVEAMKAADRIRTIYINRTKTDRMEGETSTTATATGITATTPLLPPGVWAGSAAFLAVGVVCTPVRRRLLHAVAAPRNNHHQFHAFVDLLITPLMAILAAQTGIACFSLFGSKYYLDRVVQETTAAATTSSTTTTNNNSIEELCHELVFITQTIPPSPSQQQQQFVANTTNTNTNTSTTNSSTVVVQSAAAVVSPSASSWDPRVQTMNSLRMAIQNCQRIRTNTGSKN